MNMLFRLPEKKYQPSKILNSHTPPPGPSEPKPLRDVFGVARSHGPYHKARYDNFHGFIEGQRRPLYQNITIYLTIIDVREPSKSDVHGTLQSIACAPTLCLLDNYRHNFTIKYK
jgi:hypothetical protein